MGLLKGLTACWTRRHGDTGCEVRGRRRRRRGDGGDGNECLFAVNVDEKSDWKNTTD
jgi:hypothetical protein